MLTILAFVVAIGLLVAVHECGHFAAARYFQVRVLQFSIGMGPALLTWTCRKNGTEYRIGCLPIGGYVHMLGEEDDSIPDRNAHGLSFPELTWFKKSIVALAGPLANLVFAVLLFSALGWHGLERALPILGAPSVGSRLAQAGFTGGERVLRLGGTAHMLQNIESFDDLHWRLAQFGQDEDAVTLEYQTPGSPQRQQTTVVLQGLPSPSDGDGGAFYRALGLNGPMVPAVLGELQDDGAARAAGLRSGDRVVQVDGVAVVDAGQLRERIRLSGASGQPPEQRWQILRGGSSLIVAVTPRLVQESKTTIGRVGAVIGQRPESVTIRYGFLDGLQYGGARTWELCAMTWKTLIRMVAGQGSLQQLSGPLTIADYAGKSAALGFESFVHFLALLSVSLGVLNLLPIPVLDGGHLMYYLWESLYKRPVPAPWAARLQKAGLVVLVLMMSIAISNDLARLLR